MYAANFFGTNYLVAYTLPTGDIYDTEGVSCHGRRIARLGGF